MDKINKRSQALCYISTILLIYLEWGYAPVIAQSISGTIKTLLMVLAVIPLVFLKSFQFSRNSLILFLYFVCVIIFQTIRDGDLANNILFFVPLICAFVYSSAFPLGRIIRTYCNIITILAVFSILLYIVSLILPSFIQRFPILPNAFGTPIHNLGISVVPSGLEAFRNYGITWEPGAFALLLCLSIFALITGHKELNTTKLIINIVALITTLSTMGVVVLLGIVLITRFSTSNAKQKKSSLFLQIVFLVALIFFLSAEDSEMHRVLFSKLEGFSLLGGNAKTTQDRLNAIIFPGKAFLSSPIIGVGYEEFVNINVNYCDQVATNTIINWFAYSGMLLGIPCTYYYFKSIIKTSRYLNLGFIGILILILVFGLLVSTESLLRISLIYVIIFKGCVNNTMNYA